MLPVCYVGYNIYFQNHILITIYYSHIHSYLIYGLLVWGFRSGHDTILQKTIRVVAKRAYNSHTTPIFNELGILKINDLYQVQLYKIHNRNINNLLPVYFRTFAQFLTLYGDHNYNLRNSHFRLPMTKRYFFVQSKNINI